MKKVFVLLLSAGVLLCACTKTPEAASKLEVDVTELTTTNMPGVKKLVIETDGPWHMEISEPWLVASKLSGDGNATVKLAVTNNADYSSREAIITITAGSLVKKVTLTQAQLNGIILSETEKSIGYEAGEYTISVQTNVALTAVSDAEWLTVTASKALAEEGIPVTYVLNPGREARTAHVTVSGEHLQQVFTFTQEAFAPAFSVTDELGVGAWGTLSAPKEGLSYSFTVTTNMDYQANAPDADWIHVTQEADVVSVTIDANTSAARENYIYMGCAKEGVDYSDYGAMIKVSQKGASSAVELWKQDFFWGIFPQSTRVSTAVAGDYMAIFSPNAITAGFHLMKRTDGTEASVMASPVENVTGVANDDAGNVIVTTGGNYPMEDGVTQIPLKVYVMTADNFLAGTFGEPILTYTDGFYGYGLDNARVTGDAKNNALLVMTSGCGGGGSYVVAWEIKDGATTNEPTAYSACSSIGGDLWDSFHGVSIGPNVDLSEGYYFGGYLADYNVHYTAATGDATVWNVAFTTGYTWEGAVNAADVFAYDGHRYMAVVGMNYFAYADWDGNGTIDDYPPCTLWILNIDDPTAPSLVIKQDYTANPDNWQYGDNTDISIVKEGDLVMAYLVDASASTYRKFEIQF